MTQETVIFLGAGASRALGLPLTNDILPGIVKGLQDETLFGNDASSPVSLCSCFTAMLPGLRIRLRTPARYLDGGASAHHGCHFGNRSSSPDVQFTAAGP
jgi:hypothetical protein